MNRALKVVIWSLVTLILVLGALAGGILLGRHNATSEIPALVQSDKSDTDRLFDEVRRVIKDEALKPSSDASITSNAISGMLKSLDDPYAVYFDKKHYGYFQEETTGQFGGIGVTLSVDKGVAKIVSVLEDTPAKKAGLKPGDIIQKVDGWTKKGWTSDEVVSKVRGEKGTTVVLTIARKGVKDFDVSIVRAQISTPNTITEMEGKDVGYIRLMTFNAQATDDIRKAVNDLGKKGAKGYVLDLRENPGGLLAQGVDVASLFIKSGPIVRVDERGKPEDVQMATGQYLTDKPLVVLIDGESASASEILAGALQDYHRATLVGTKSYGKGSVQTVRELSNGGAIKLTIAHYLTPDKRSIDRKGLTPDVLVPMDVEKQAEKKTDLQYQEAVRVLRTKLK